MPKIKSQEPASKRARNNRGVGRTKGDRSVPFPLFDRDWPRLIAKALVVESGCWEWQAARKPPMGYGVIGIRLPGRRAAVQGAHRVAYTLWHGLSALPELCVLHKCDNPRCVNPEHLFLGTQRENLEDARAKGRHATGARSGAHTHPESRSIGSKNWHAKLVERDVLEIRRAYAAGTSSRVELAAEYGVHRSGIDQILRRHTWRHV